MFGLVVDGEQEDGVVGDQQVGDDAGATGFAFSFGGDGQAYFVAVITQGGALIGSLFQTGDKLLVFLFNGVKFFRQPLDLFFKRGGGDDVITH